MCPKENAPVRILIFLAFLAIVPAFRLFATPDVASGAEVWFSADSSVTTGNGALVSPFPGSGSQFGDTLEAWFTNGRSNLTIHLLPGTYLSKSDRYVSNTQGGPLYFTGIYLPKNTRLVGAGMQNTVIQSTATTNANPLTEYITIGYRPVNDASADADYMEISDLTVDANYGVNNRTNAPHKGHNLQSFYTQRNLIERVKITGFGASGYGGVGGSEVFPVLFANLNTNLAVGHSTVQDSYFEGPVLGSVEYAYASLISAWFAGNVVGTNRYNIDSQWTAGYTNSTLFVRNNRFLNCPSSFAINSAVPNATIEGNFFANIGSCIHVDTYGTTNLIVRNNQMIGVTEGIYLSTLQGAGNVLVDGNTIQLAPETVVPGCVSNSACVALPCAGITLRLTTGGSIVNNKISIFPPYDDGTFKDDWVAFHVWQTEGDSGITLAKNVISPLLPSRNLAIAYTPPSATVVGNKSGGYSIAPSGFPPVLFRQITSSDNMVFITTEIGSHIPTMSTKIVYLSGTNQGIVVPQPHELPGCRFTLAAFRNYPWLTGPVPLMISGQATNDYSQTQDPTGGGSFVIDSPSAVNQFYDPQTSYFAKIFPLFTSSAGQRMITVDLESTGYQWIVHRR